MSNRPPDRRPQDPARGEERWETGPETPDLPSSEVHVWRGALDPDAERARSLAPLLSRDERERAARFRFEADARRYTIARGGLRRLLARYLHASPEAIALSESAHGRPFVSAPSPPPGFDFNLSHARDLVIYAVTRSARVGVDVEWRTALPDMAELVALHFSAREQATWRSLPEASREGAFFDCWTRKEAFVKAIGEGLSHPLDAFDVSLAPDAPAELQRVEGADPARWSLHDLRPGPGYAAALAVESPVVRLRRFALAGR